MTVIGVLVLVLYIGVSVWIALRLADICRHAEKYEERELQAAAEELEHTKGRPRGFKSLSHLYSMVNVLFMLASTAVAYGVIVALSFLAAKGETNILLDSQTAGTCAAIFWNITAGLVIIPLHIKRRFFAVTVLDAFNCSDRAFVWQRGYALLFIFFALFFPFYGLACNNYAHFNESGITVSRYFRLDETYTAYEDIEEVRIYVRHDRGGHVDAFCYEIRLSDGKRFDINHGVINNEMRKTTLALHKFLEKKATCKPTITPLNDLDRNYIRRTCTAAAAEAIDYIFEGFHEGRHV